MKKVFTVILIVLFVLSCAFAAVLQFRPEWIPDSLSGIGVLKAIAPAVGSASVIVGKFFYSFLQKRKRIKRRQAGQLYGMAVFQPHFLKRVQCDTEAHEQEYYFLIDWKNTEGRVAETEMPLLYGSDDTAEIMQKKARLTTNNPNTTFKRLSGRNELMGFTGAVSRFCKSYQVSRNPKYSWIIFFANEDTSTADGVILDRCFALPVSFLLMFLDQEFIKKHCAVSKPHKVDRIVTLYAVAKQVFCSARKEGTEGGYYYQIMELDLPMPGNEIFWDQNWDILPHQANKISKASKALVKELLKLKSHEGDFSSITRRGDVCAEFDIEDSDRIPGFTTLNNVNLDQRFLKVDKGIEIVGGASPAT